jgi:TonB family protein
VSLPGPSLLRILLHLAATLALLGPAVPCGAQDKPIVYNNMEGDGGVVLDRQIKEAYGGRYKVVDTRQSEGYAEPLPVAGEMPKSPLFEPGHLLGGYVLMVYIVSDKGLVADPVVVRSTDPRLSKAALEAMAQWRFKPGTRKGVAVATTAAQEFNFGPVDVSNGYKMERLASYQSRDVLIKRMPPAEAVSAYVAQVKEVAHNFFVGATTPEILHIVVIIRPGNRSRAWLTSSRRPGDSPELEPLRRLVESVKPLEVREGPVILGISGTVAGGDATESLQGDAYHNPVPGEWRALAKSLRDPPPFSSDAFMDLVWPGAK